MREKPTYDELEKRLAELENRYIERRSEKENSREDLEKYREIVEQAPTGIYEVDIVKQKINFDVKVLLSSGYSVDGQATEILKRGCNGFIQKPYSMKKLSHKIGETIKD